MIEKFRDYQKQHDFSEYMPLSLNQEWVRFGDWAEKHSVDKVNASVDELYEYKDYIDSLGKKTKPDGYRKASYNRLNYLKHIYNAIGREKNPVLLMEFPQQMRGKVRGALTEVQLNKMYQKVGYKDDWQFMLKIILGLFIYQGIEKKDVSEFEVDDIDFENRSVFIEGKGSGKNRTRRRVVPLYDEQVNDFKVYLDEVRPKLMNVNTDRVGDRLFFNRKGGSDLLTPMRLLSDRLKKQFYTFTRFNKLRESRIVLWVEKHKEDVAWSYTGMIELSSINRYVLTDEDKLWSQIDDDCVSLYI